MVFTPFLNNSNKAAISEFSAEPLDEKNLAYCLGFFSNWYRRNGCLTRLFYVKNYYEVCVLAEVVMQISAQEKYYPEITFGKNYCQVVIGFNFTKGVSERDFAFAAKIEEGVSSLAGVLEPEFGRDFDVVRLSTEPDSSLSIQGARCGS